MGWGRGERKGGFPAQGESGVHAVVFASQHPFLLLVTAPSLSFDNYIPRPTPTPSSKGRHRLVEYMALGLKDLTRRNIKHKNRPRLAEISDYYLRFK